jgi:hypothetical protein
MKKIIYISIVLFAVFSLQSCSKTTGCQDPNAENFNADAKEDCNCCEYEGNLVFWQAKASADDFADLGVKTLFYYVDEQLVGSSSATFYWSGKPNCGQNGTVTVTKDLKGSKSRAYTYKVIDEDGFTWYDGILNFDANTCLSFELK